MIIAPSLLAANFGRLAAETSRAGAAGADWLHLDIMDGHFVPNLSFGPGVVRALRPCAKMFFDVHLMCERPEILVEPFIEAGAQQLTVHAELGPRVDPLLWKIRSFDTLAGIAVNPSTPVSLAEPFLDRIQLLLIMTVNPGFGGQEFIHEVIPKIQQAAALRASRGAGFRIQVDGGINFTTAIECARAGADVFVSGTCLFKSRNMRAAIRKMRNGVENAARLTPSRREAQSMAGSAS